MTADTNIESRSLATAASTQSYQQEQSAVNVKWRQKVVSLANTKLT